MSCELFVARCFSRSGAGTSCLTVSHEYAFVEMERMARAFGRMRVVCHHDDRLAVLAIKRVLEIQDLVAGFTIEVAGWLVAEEQHRIGDDRPRDADALFLAA